MVQEKTIVISNTSPLISLLLIGKIEILKGLFRKVLIPNEVYDEIILKEQKITIDNCIKKGYLVRSKATKLPVLHGLDKGEAFAISLALEFDNSLLIMDDRRGKELAESIGIRVVGTIGVLLFAKKVKAIKNIKELLDKLIKYNRWISKDLYEKTLQLAKE